MGAPRPSGRRAADCKPRRPSRGDQGTSKVTHEPRLRGGPSRARLQPRAAAQALDGAAAVGTATARTLDGRHGQEATGAVLSSSGGVGR